MGRTPYRKIVTLEVEYYRRLLTQEIAKRETILRVLTEQEEQLAALDIPGRSHRGQNGRARPGRIHRR